MDICGADTVKATGRDIQRHMFISNLGKVFAEMDRMEDIVSSRNAKLDTLASSYVRSGMTADETVELLVEDGFGVEIARNYVTSMMHEPEEEDGVWDYVYETVNGSIRRGSDRGHIINASTKEEALDLAQEKLMENYNPVMSSQERLLDVEKI